MARRMLERIFPFSGPEAMVVDVLTAPNPRENGSLVSGVATPRIRRPIAVPRVRGSIAVPRVRAQRIVVVNQRVRLAEANQR